MAKKLTHVAHLIKEAYEKGLTDIELAKMYNCSEGTIRRVIIDAGGVRRGPGRRKGVQNKKDDVAEVLNGVQ